MGPRSARLRARYSRAFIRLYSLRSAGSVLIRKIIPQVEEVASVYGPVVVRIVQRIVGIEVLNPLGEVSVCAHVWSVPCSVMAGTLAGFGGSVNTGSGRNLSCVLRKGGMLVSACKRTSCTAYWKKAGW